MTIEHYIAKVFVDKDFCILKDDKDTEQSRFKTILKIATLIHSELLNIPKQSSEPPTNLYFKSETIQREFRIISSLFSRM